MIVNEEGSKFKFWRDFVRNSEAFIRGETLTSPRTNIQTDTHCVVYIYTLAPLSGMHADT
jgi:hypothetical protein